MNGQMSLFDFKIENLRPPELWDCMRTCENANKHTDRFPTGEKRCLYGIQQDGTTGDDIYTEIDKDGYVRFYCKYYRPR